MEKCVIVVAGGKGLRMGGDIPKQFRLIGGRPVLMHTLEAFCRYDESIGLVVVLPIFHIGGSCVGSMLFLFPIRS